ncbi:hypothetical protein AMJ52_01445 [candidate division TA06 bacterium DG_78]|uniref:Mth938-like domain-containing protein n=1 Tax=candidate division TA06 bacterium DG_78 TaxID=1703772 RepID=A0A0S7YHG9_UNCT6|nr:MAG: hypothetical protein AMJ52_01445 [candidate division TA06 bacterium DG_78]
MIDDYRFGEITIAGKTYRTDVIVYPDHIDAHWWREQGHNLAINDIKNVIDAKPDVVVIGTGELGLMQVEKETVDHLKKLGIKIIVLPTKKAYIEFNRLVTTQKVVACLHLTC